MNQALTVKDDMSLSELGSVFVKSGFFADTRDAAQATVKILAGRELGFGPMASMTGVYIVKGRVSVSANLMAAAVKRTGRYNYRLIEHTDKACEIAFFEGKEDIGHSRFTAEDARKAGTQNMEKYPRNMLFARAMSNGVKWFCADVFGGPIYTPEEMGAKVDEDGDVVEMPVIVAKVEPPAAPRLGLDLSKPNGHMAQAQVIEAADDDDIPQPPVIDDAPDLSGLVDTRAAAPATPARASSTASMKIRTPANSKAWQVGCKALATKYPAYQTTVRGELSGQPDYFHILGAAKKCLFDTVTDDNFNDVLTAVANRAAEALPA